MHRPSRARLLRCAQVCFPAMLQSCPLHICSWVLACARWSSSTRSPFNPASRTSTAPTPSDYVVVECGCRCGSDDDSEVLFRDGELLIDDKGLRLLPQTTDSSNWRHVLASARNASAHAHVITPPRSSPRPPCNFFRRLPLCLVFAGVVAHTGLTRTAIFQTGL